MKVLMIIITKTLLDRYIYVSWNRTRSGWDGCALGLEIQRRRNKNNVIRCYCNLFMKIVTNVQISRP